MKEQIQENSELENKALRVVECLLEDSVDEKFLVDSVGSRGTCLLYHTTNTSLE